MAEEKVHVYVSGNVQGVFFRANTREQARKLGLTGWVRNLADGRVEAVAEGPKEKLEELAGFFKSSPGASSVREVEEDWSKARGEYSDFTVRR